MTDYWQHRAACAGVSNPDVFFDGRANVRAEAAKLCATCPVFDQCQALGGTAFRGVHAGKFMAPKSTGPSLTEPFLEEHGTETAVALHRSRRNQMCGPCRRWVEKQTFGGYVEARVSA